MALTPSQKNVLEHALFKTRAFLQNEMHKIKDDPTQYTKVTNLNFQIALLMSMEATGRVKWLVLTQKNQKMWCSEVQEVQ